MNQDSGTDRSWRHGRTLGLGLASILAGCSGAVPTGKGGSTKPPAGGLRAWSALAEPVRGACDRLIPFAGGGYAWDGHKPLQGSRGPRCVYEWRPSTPRQKAPDERLVNAHPRLSALPIGLTTQARLDAHAFGPSSSIADWYHSNFLHHAGAWQDPQGGALRAPVTVVVIDDIESPFDPRQPGQGRHRLWTRTTRFPHPTQARGAHGLAVARTIEELACPLDLPADVPCPVRVEAVNAFETISLLERRGTEATLARAIDLALHRYAGDPGFLVLNISLGITHEVMRSDLAQRALRRAENRGAVVVVAAGNTHATRLWPNYASETFPARDAQMMSPNAQGRSLISVLGLKSSGAPLSISRAERHVGRSLAAMAEYATPDFRMPASHAPVYHVSLTGTSMAAAVVSAAYAAVASAELDVAQHPDGLDASARQKIESILAASALPPAPIPRGQHRVHVADALNRQGQSVTPLGAPTTAGPLRRALRTVGAQHALIGYRLLRCQGGGLWGYTQIFASVLPGRSVPCVQGEPLDIRLDLVPQPIPDPTCASCTLDVTSGKLALFEDPGSFSERFLELGAGDTVIKTGIKQPASKNGVEFDVSAQIAALPNASVDSARMIYMDPTTGQTASDEIFLLY